ncbi:MAG: cyclic nucleotide-binding domain-containing protein [Microcoleus sp. SIO2G3]|nr:cyclic nucleotide-binding domain-containing protein [Microcoleus sp. SIO2G3]
MTEVLLKELSNSDINWISAMGRQQEIAAGTVLVQEGQAADTLHIVLDGTLTVTVSQADNNPLSRAFAAMEGGETSGREIARLSSGEVVGEIPFLGTRPTATTVKAIEKSLVMSIPQQQLAAKLQQDVGFASRFYRAIAILLSDRLQSIVSQLTRSKLAQGQALRDMLFVLGGLNDSDIDWMIATGSRQKIAANTVLIHSGGPVDALYILLNGTMIVSVCEDERNPLARAFAVLEGEGGETSGREISRLSRGEIVGETPFIDARLPSVTVKTLEDSMVLSIPRQQLAAKLQQDVGFASRFYRVIATLLSNRLQGMLGRIGYGRRVYSKGQSLDESIEYEDELDSNVLDSMALAGTRFDWMLSRLRGI